MTDDTARVLTQRETDEMDIAALMAEVSFSRAEQVRTTEYVERLRDENNRLRRLDAQFALVEVWICMNTDFAEADPTESGVVGMLTALERLRRGWRPIQDVTPEIKERERLVLLWAPGTHGYIVLGHYSNRDGGWLAEDGDTGWPCVPTLWAPIPGLPVNADANRDAGDASPPD